jgi:hypothetical protein
MKGARRNATDVVGLRPGSQRERYRQVSNLTNDFKNSRSLALSSGVSLFKLKTKRIAAVPGEVRDGHTFA